MSQSLPLTTRTVSAFVLTMLIWGSTWLVIKGQLGTVSPDWSVAWRFSLAAGGMFALAKLRGESLRLPRAPLRAALMVGALQFFGNYAFVYRSEHYLPSGLVAVIFALLLVPNAVFARIFLGTPVTARFVGGSAVALGGIALLMLNEYRIAPLGPSVLTGFAFAGAALICASLSNVIQASAAVRAHPMMAQIGWAMAFGALIDAVFAAITSGPPQIELSATYLGGLLYLALIGSVAAFPLYYMLIRDWGPGRAAYNGVAVPVVAMALSTLFEHYRWTLLAGAGASVAMVGLLIALSGRSTAAPVPIPGE